MAESARAWGRPEAAQKICEDLLVLAGLAGAAAGPANKGAAPEPKPESVAAPATPAGRDA
jgi:hypothetical protein